MAADTAAGYWKMQKIGERVAYSNRVSSQDDAK
jgi:hypothetical protein